MSLFNPGQLPELSSSRRRDRAGAKSLTEKSASRFAAKAIALNDKLTADDYRALAREQCHQPLTDGPVAKTLLAHPSEAALNHYAARVLKFVAYQAERDSFLDLELEGE